MYGQVGRIGDGSRGAETKKRKRNDTCMYPDALI